MESAVIEMIIQGGAVGVALSALYLVHYCVKTITNHLTDVAETLGKMSSVLDHLERRLINGNN